MNTRTLTIMFTDIKGFTSKTSASSRAELKRMLELHSSLIEPVFKQYGGRIVKTIGDAFMVTFQSPTDAVLCGMKVQQVLDGHNETAGDGDRLEVRIAINTGEVALKGRDVFGEAVNIASRLEGIADVGDIYFTESVYLSMNKSEIPTSEVGHRRFKGIPQEIKVYKVLKEKKTKGGKPKQLPASPYQLSRRDKIIWWVGLIVLLLVAISIFKGFGLLVLVVYGIWWLIQRWRKKE